VKTLFTITAAIEAMTGVALEVAPSSVVLILLGTPLESPAGVVIARILGAALFSLGTACAFERAETHVRPAGLIVSMLVYNTAVGALLAYARVSAGLSGVALWPAVIVHSALAVWCIACLRISHPREG
jgi:hypothetical protein